MNLIKRLGGFPQTHWVVDTKGFLSVAMLGAMLSGCGGSSGELDTGGYFKFYNAASHSPAIYASLDDRDYPGIGYSHSTNLYTLDDGSYELSLAYQESSNDFYTINEQLVDIKKGEIDLVVFAGDIANPQVFSYEFDNLTLESEDDQFAIRVLNMHQASNGVDIYLARDDQSFNEALLITSVDFSQMSENQFYDLDTYKFYLTAAGSSEILYESTDIGFVYTSEYVLVVRQNIGPSQSDYSIDILNKAGGTVAYPDKDSQAEIRFYNGLYQHELLPQFDDQIALEMDGLDDQINVEALAKGQFSEAIELSFGDYALDIAASGQSAAFAENYFLSLGANSDKTIFVYQTIVEEQEDGDPDTVEETELFVNILPVDNSQRVSLYDHQIKVINLVDDFSQLELYFARDNETVDSAAYAMEVNRVSPKTITLPNNTYDLSIVGHEDQSDVLLAFEQLSLNADSGDLFLVIEENHLTDGYQVTVVEQAP